MASEGTGEVGRCTDAFGTELTFFEVQGRVVIDAGGLGIALDDAGFDEFMRLAFEAKRRAETHQDT